MWFIIWNKIPEKFWNDLKDLKLEFWKFVSKDFGKSDIIWKCFKMVLRKIKALNSLWSLGNNFGDECMHHRLSFSSVWRRNCYLNNLNWNFALETGFGFEIFGKWFKISGVLFGIWISWITYKIKNIDLRIRFNLNEVK